MPEKGTDVPPFSAPWFLGGKEIELPTLKMDGELAIAELQAKHDVFVDLASTFTAQLRFEARVGLVESYLQYLTEGEKSKDAITRALQYYGFTFAEPFDKDIEHKTRVALQALNIDIPTNKKLERVCRENLDDLRKRLTSLTEDALKSQMKAQPVILEKGLLDAYYRLKQLDVPIVTKGKDGKDIELPMTLENLKKVISSSDINKYFIKPETERQKRSLADLPETSEEIKKK